MIYLIHDRIISEKIIATSDTHIKVSSTGFRLSSCLPFFPESVVFLLAVIVSLPFFSKISSLKYESKGINFMEIICFHFSELRLSVILFAIKVGNGKKGDLIQ